MSIPTISRGSMLQEQVPEYFKFVCPPSSGGRNPDPQPPTVFLRRDLLSDFDLRLRDGGRVRMWIIEDPDDKVNGRTFPSAPIRVPLNALVNADVNCKGGTHTIHWHGIEPTPMNDGVGHTSFEVDGHFIYQFQPRHAGTYFYHCHKNTVLHFEMGLYGLLLVDPPKPDGSTVEGPPYPIGKPGFVAAFSPLTDHVVPYDVEAFWVPDSIDSRWHTLNHDAFMQKCDADDPINPSFFSRNGIFNDFRPDIFLLSGLPRRKSDGTPFGAADSPLVAPKLRVGQTLLARTTNADYLIQRFKIGLDAQVIAMDGHALGVPPFEKYSHPIDLPAGTPFTLTSAMRWDLIMRPTKTGVFPVTIEFLNQITGQLLYTARTSVTVTL